MELLEQAARQRGLITRAQAIAFGMSESAISRKIAAGEWIRVRTRVFRLAGSSSDIRQEMLALCLSSPAAVVSHRAAAWLHGFGGGARLEVTMPGTSAPRWGDVRIHRVAELPSRYVMSLDGIRVTTPARTCVDMSAVVDDEALDAVVHEALRFRATTVPAIRDAARFIEEQAGRARLAALLGLLDGLRTESALESRILRWLKRARLPQPVTQYRFVVGSRELRFDLAFPEKRIAIELDGFAFHGQRERYEQDRERDALCIVAGWRVLRFTARSSERFVVSTIRAALNCREMPA